MHGAPRAESLRMCSALITFVEEAGMAYTDRPTYGALLAEALDANNKHQVKILVDCCRAMLAVIPEPDPELGKAAAAFLNAMRDNRRYDQIQMMGEAYIKTGYTTPRIWTVYAQALVDRGSQVAAIGILTGLLADQTTANLKQELPEIYGLRARAWKDIGYEAINAKRPAVAERALRKAYQGYAQGLAEAPASLSLLSWHGTQCVAVAHLASSNELDISVPPQDQLARTILTEVATDYEIKGATDVWFLAAAGEMSVALGDLAGAATWYGRMLKAEPDGFTIAGAHRQLTQIWKVGESPDGIALVAMLVNGLAKANGGFTLSGGDAKQLQAKIGGYDAITMFALRAAIGCAGSVAMITRQFRALGTGFVVDAASLGLENIGKVVVTNAHVVSRPPEYDAAVPNDVQIKFELLGRVPYRVRKIVASLPVGEHDCSVLQLTPDIPDEIAALDIGELPDVLPDDPTACVIGHPLGQEISFSFLDGKLVGFEPLTDGKPQRMHYRSPTDIGNSGSPVFNRNWQVIGIHRAYNPFASALNGQAGTYSANEGISLASIRAAFTAKRVVALAAAGDELRGA